MLSFVQLAAQPRIELGFGDVEVDALDRGALRLQHGAGEIRQPVRDLVVLVVARQRSVIILALALDRVSQGNQARLPEILRQRFFGERPPDPAIAVFERWMHK